MEYLKVSILLLLGVVFSISSCKDDEETCIETVWYEDADDDGLGNPDVSQFSCEQPDGYVTDNSDTNDAGGSGTPLSAFDDFNPEAVTFSFDGNEVTIESNGLPNHTSPYWEDTHPLHIEQVVGDHLTPGRINSGSFTVTLPLDPQLATSSSATGLGAIGISVTGAPIFNDEEGPNRPLDEATALGFDYAGGHNGPSGYHYHIESSDVPENTILSFDDEQLVGIMADGFLIYGRKCNAIGDHPADLDESGGHTSSTQHSDGEEFYHYHIINEFYINSYILLFGGDLQGTPNTIF
ncbi:YHYH protein [Lewinella cohaerens]|uniref:YHYH protein n=1 Tax=Lewinella cohaerens TaxID=70995 RepID=UPI00035FBC6B|nr:YHYH protein [Lewinella cohaerens]